jgi:carbon-monoxide dehydrogenase medium subunit
MFAPEFDYHKANTVAEAIDLLASNPGAKAMAGGHSLIPLLKLRLARPGAVVDISGVSEMKGISVNNGSIRIGALTTHWEIESSSELQSANSLLAEAAGGIGDTQVRNRGTIGGNLSHADPASDWGTVLTALGATLEIRGPGGASRTVSPTELIVGPLTTSLGETELLTAINVPVLTAGQRGEYAKMSHPASGYAVVGAAVVVNVDHHTCTGASIAVGGATPVPVRVTSVENGLTGKELNNENITAATSQAAGDLGDEILGDFYASAEYRRAMAAVEIRHALFHATGVAHH